MQSDQDARLAGAQMTTVEHLEELRRRLIIASLALAVATLFSLFFTGRLLEFLMIPAGGIKPVFLKPTEMFVTYFKVALVGGVALAMPVFVYQLIRFIAPGLTPGEKKYLFFVLPGASLLFLCGASFAYWVVVPFALRYLLTFGGGIATAFISIGEYISFVVTFVIWMGVVFELPMVLVFLTRLRVVSYRQLRGYWRYALVGAFVIAAVITPTPDPLNQTLVALPL
ncbi:MAG TPA: twin-arginine translocase subunit TatC, partial [Chloroflexota bacterium]|nr:twin-arginine translocase subunit TatC [Chloroflexota bacterium]